MKLRRLLGEQLAWVFRVTLGVVFIVASLDKIAHPEAFAAGIANYHMVPLGLINLMAICLPWIEVVCGLLLVLGLWTRANLLVVNALLVVFIVAIVSALRRGLDISCGCFTTDPGAHAMTRWTLYWDIIWLGMGLHAMVLDRNLLSVTRLLRRTGATGETT
jgi:uncharacterized membrane protein YphA (DoxX/SURF4 family)